jgi:hypothetical protein
MFNTQNELEQESPVFMMDGGHLSHLKNQTKSSKGGSISKETKKAIKLFRSNRSNKRAQA